MQCVTSGDKSLWPVLSQPVQQVVKEQLLESVRTESSQAITKHTIDTGKAVAARASGGCLAPDSRFPSPPVLQRCRWPPASSSLATGHSCCPS